LHEVFAPFDLGGEICVEFEAKLKQRGHNGSAVLGRFRKKNICILRGIREAEQYRSRFAEKQISDAVPHESVANLLSLPIFKRGHSLTNSASFPHTNGDSPPSYPRRGIVRRP
jgi:hypothetical protein